MKTLTEQDYKDAGESLNCEVAAIKAVDAVEAPRGGFLPDGRPTILFERHKFSKYTHGQYDDEYPDISNKKRGGYKGGALEWNRLERAAALDRDAAYMSASWGKYQIMGFNYADCGFESVAEFVEAMKIGEREQLNAFVELIKSWHLDDDLRNHKWTQFAQAYNGAAFKENEYDLKLARAYTRFKKQKPTELTVNAFSGESAIDSASDPQKAAETPSEAPQQPVSQTNEPQSSGTQVNVTPSGSDPIVSKPDDPAIQASTGGFKSMLATASANIAAIGAAVWAAIKDNAVMLKWAIIVGGGVLAIYLLRQIILDVVRMWIKATPQKYNVK